MKKLFYTKEQLENIADEQNRLFDPERLEKPKDFDIYDFADLIGAKYEWIYITPVQQILGAVFFDNSIWYSWPEPYFTKEMKPETIAVTKGTILIDRTVNESKDKGRENFIAAHECFHYLLHFKRLSSTPKNKTYYLISRPGRERTRPPLICRNI